MKQDNTLSLEKVFGLDFEQSMEKLIEEILTEITSKKDLDVEESLEEEIIINYSCDEKSHSLIEEPDRSIALCIAAGLPHEVFDKAEEEFKKVINDYDSNCKYVLEGHLVRGAFAQYAGIMSANDKKKYEVISYNGLGIKRFAKFQGNEFLGYKFGFFYYLDDVINDSGNSEEILHALIDKQIIRHGNITSEFRKGLNNELNVDKLKRCLVEIFNEKLELEKEEIEELVEENFNPELVKRKMRFIDRYQKYQNSQNKNIKNYILSNNIAARLFEHIGSSYLVDKQFEKDKGVSKRLSQLLKQLDEEQIKYLVGSSSDLFKPFYLLEEGANGKRPKNKFRKLAEVGEITDRLSNDYLQALIKDIIIDIYEKDETLLTEIFKKDRRTGGREVLLIIEDRLCYSQKLKGFIKENDLYYKSQLLKDNPELFDDFEKIYPLDRVVIEKLKQMSQFEFKKLWDWKLCSDGIFMLLGKEVESDEEIIEYHSESKEGGFDNQLEELELDLEEPSKNQICGSIKKSANYSKELDQDYHYSEEESYNFSSKQGVGFVLDCRWTSPEYGVKVDGEDVSGVYEEIDREEAEIGEREKSLRDRYFGEDIILRNAKEYSGKLSGKLIYLYGAEKKDELVIEGFANGDYGIELEAKIKEEEEKLPISYTSYKVRFDNFEFVVLEKLEIKKAIYQHSKLKVRGLISDEEYDDYLNYLQQEKPEVVVTCLEDERKVLFKGFVEDYELLYINSNYYLEFQAVSYSRLLEHKKINRIYQNEGTTYGEVFEMIEEEHSEFNILFGKEELMDEELVSEEDPVILQYQENDWDFLRRIISYTEQIVIIDDTKDDSEKINVLAGEHDAPTKELKNKKGTKIKAVNKEGKEYVYYKVNGYCYNDYLTEDNDFERPIFELGSFVDYKINNQDEKTEELVVTKNRIYVEKGLLYSDLTLTQKGEYKIRKRKRKNKIAGKSFLAEIKDVKDDHTAQVEFINLKDDFDYSTAYYYPLDRIYTNAYFAPEEGDIVDVYFKSEKEKYASIKSNSSDQRCEKVEIKDINPEDKKIFNAEGYQIELTEEYILIADKEKEIVLKISEEEIRTYYGDDNISLLEDKINVVVDSAEIIIEGKEIECKFGSNEMIIADGEITLG